MTRAGRARRRTLGRRDAQTAALARDQKADIRYQIFRAPAVWILRRSAVHQF